MEFEGAQSTSWHWPLLLAVVFLNICLPSLVLSYGVFLVHLAELDVPLWQGIGATTIFIVTYGLSQCWCRDAADSWGGTVGYRVMAAVGLLTVVTGLLICAFVPYHVQPIIYGILGGLGSSLISAQVDAVIFDTYDSRLGLIRGTCFVGQAVGQAIFPHLLTILIQTYGYSFSFIVYSGILFQVLPAIILLKVDDSIKKPLSFSRYSDLAKTYAVFSNDGMDNNYYTAELQLHDLSKKCWKSPSDDNLHREDMNDEVGFEHENVTVTPPPSPEEKRRNIFGVEILPEIPEESEDEEEEYYTGDKNMNLQKKRLSNAIKRLSTLGDSLDDCIIKQIRRDSRQSDKSENSDNVNEYSEVEVTYENISPVTDIQREKVFNSFSFRCQSAYASMRRKMWMPSYRVYRIKRRLLFFMYNLNDTFIKPLTRSLSCWKFYPSLLLAFTKLSLTGISSVLLPILGTQIIPQISKTEINFLMSLHGFTWVCFLLSTPWLAQTPKRNYKYVAVLGLMISTAACFLLASAHNHDTFSIGCVVAGFGYGAVTSCSETAIQDFVGARKWPKIHSPLETLSATLFGVFALGSSLFFSVEGGLQFSLFILGVVLSVVTFIWLILAFVSIYITKVRSARLGRRWIF